MLCLSTPRTDDHLEAAPEIGVELQARKTSMQRGR